MRSTIAVLIVAASALYGTEKSTIGGLATLVVVGTLHPNPPFPWFDGWHFTGTIDVEEVLHGSISTKRLAYRLIESSPNRDFRMFPTAFRYFYRDLRTKALWFLNPIDAQTWRPSLYFGCDELSESPYYEQMFHPKQ
jgi:hypothetical protein